MYTDKNIMYAESGKYLKFKNQVAFQMPASEGIVECDLNYDDLFSENNIAYYNNKMFAQRIIKNGTYADYKREFIKKRYSNDDQIAIMLNKDDSEEDLLRYNRMMEWRKFASAISNKLIEVLK